MALITPKGSAAPVYGAIPSFPLMPQAWPLTQGGITGLLNVDSSVNPNAGTEHQAALVQASNANNRLI